MGDSEELEEDTEVDDCVDSEDSLKVDWELEDSELWLWNDSDWVDAEDRL